MNAFNYKFSVIWLVFCLILILIDVFFVSNQPYLYSVDQVLQKSSGMHWFGTDELGRDLFYRVLVGLKVSVLFALFSCLILFLVGSFLGYVWAWFYSSFGSYLDSLVDTLDSIPSLIVLLLVKLVLDLTIETSQIQSFINLFLALIFTQWFSLARFVKIKTLRTLSEPYIEAQISLGASKGRLFIYGITPNIIKDLVVYILSKFPQMILFESFLSFLGMGFQAPIISLGSLLKDGWTLYLSHPYLLFWPSLFLVLTSMSVNFLLIENK
jgi:oligopeptide transport system permease protein